MKDGKMTYKQAGVDIDVSNNFVERIKPLVKMASRGEVLGGIGGFGGAFALDITRCKNPLLIGATDGVGTKLKIAQLLGRHHTVGIDLVAMSANDVVVQGAEPLFFLDYIAVGKLDAEVATQLVSGVVEGCHQAGCALLGGETAEMPGMYAEGEYDLAGFCVGVVDRDNLIDGKEIAAGDVIIGLESSGLHSNGFSLARRVLLSGENGGALQKIWADLGTTLGEALLTPTRIYVASVLQARERVKIKGLAHITGGGFFDNIPRVLPPTLGALIERGSWDIPPIFSVIKKTGAVEEAEMFRTFNMGIGMVAIVAAAEATATLQSLEQNGERAHIIGKVTKIPLTGELVRLVG